MFHKRKLSIILLFYLVIVPAVIYASEYAMNVAAKDELEEWASDVENLIPDMLFIIKAQVDVSYDRSSPFSTDTITTKTLTSTLSMPALSDVAADLIGILPDVDVSNDEENFGIPALVGAKQFHADIDNRTDTAYTQLDIAANYNPVTYPYLLFEQIESAVKTSTTTIQVSFGATASANISAAAECYNKTLTSNTIYSSRTTLWYNLLFETNSTFPYVIHTEATNVDVFGYYAFAFKSDKVISDSRYNIAYLDTDQTSISSSSFNRANILGKEMIVLSVENPISDLSIDAITVADLNNTKMLSVSSNIEHQQDMHVVMRGWATASDLERDLEYTWRQQLELEDGDDIVGYDIDEAYFQFSLAQGLTKCIKRELTDALTVSSDYHTLVNTAMKNTLPLIGVANNKDVFEKITGEDLSINGFWDSVTDGFNSFTSTITSIAQQVIESPSNLIDILGNSIANVVTPVGHIVTGVVEPVTNMIQGTAGQLVEGVVGVAGAAKDLGSSVIDSLKWPLIIGLPAIALVALIGAAIYFGVKPKSLG